MESDISVMALQTSDESESILVTGGTGFLGMHVCTHYADQGVNVTALDLTPFQEGENHENATYVQGDVRNADVVREHATDVDAIVHTASAIPTWSDEKIRDSTVEGTRTVLEAAAAEDVDRVVHLSSAAVYGRRDRPPVTEDSPLRPRSVYGEAKVEAESIVEQYRDEGHCISVLRPQAIIGPKRLGIFQILFDWVESGANIPLIGSGENAYQLVHVHDVVAAIDLLLSVDSERANATFNVGTDEFGSMKSDFQALVDHAGTGKRVFGTPAFLSVGTLRIMDHFNLSPLYPSLFETADEDTYIEVGKLKELGWEPAYANHEALTDTYDWYRYQRSEVETTGAIGNRASREQLALRPVKHVLQRV